MMMPVMGGCEATQIIRNSIEKERQPVIIALTANAFQESKMECLESGMNDVLTKPGQLLMFFHSVHSSPQLTFSFSLAVQFERLNYILTHFKELFRK
jgi:CheY-like chemotaxis protein